MGKPGLKKIHRYSVEFKLTAVRLSQMPGVEVQTVANALDIHPFMLSRWRKEVRDGVLKGRARSVELPSRPAHNELWNWDITKLLGPAKWTYFYLYVMLDVFSRYVVGWMVVHRESATLAERFIRETCSRQGIERGQLTIHADRGPAMTSKPVALLLADLGVTKTHARPHVSNDNPFSEAQFKTLKYTDRPSRSGLGRSRMPGRTATGFSSGTTLSIVIRASGS